MEEWWRLISGSHVFSDEGYPFHVVRYNLQLLGPLCERMASTLYSSSLSMMSGGGEEKVGLYGSVER